MILPATPARRRAEEAHLIKARLANMDGQIDAMAKLMGEVAQAPLFTAADIEEVGRALVEARVRLPKYAAVTVTTHLEERRDPIFGTSTILHHTADQLCCHQLQPMSIQAAIEVGLLVRLGGRWMFSEAAYKRLVPPDPRLLP